MLKTPLYIGLLLLALGTMAAPAQANTPAPEPRIIYAPYITTDTPTPRQTLAHRFGELPLNYLGYVVQHFDVNKGTLPPITDDLHAILVWFYSGSSVNQPKEYLDWLATALDKGKKVIIIGELGIAEEYRLSTNGMQHIRQVLHRIGVEDHNNWYDVTYQAQITYENKRLTTFERRYSDNLSGYHHTTAYGQDATVHLSIKNLDVDKREVDSDLIITHPNGAYAAHGYVAYALNRKSPNKRKKGEEEEDEIEIRQWYINPFIFFNEVLGAESLPKPDVSTLNGRRIFYSHMDGDGWNSLSEVMPYQNHKAIAAKVIEEEIIRQYPDIPFSMAPIVNELQLSCYGVPQSIDVAKSMFRYDNVEPTSHTHSHPLYWGFFEDGNIAKEVPYLDYYPPRPASAKSIYSALSNLLEVKEDAWEEYRHAYYSSHGDTDASRLKKLYDSPRSYACTPLDIAEEITGSVAFIQQLAPPNKRVKLIQWSGDTTPYEEAIRIARKHNILNINGGDSRLDGEYPSYSYVSPVGVQVGNERQIYSSNSNENTYTELWTDRFFGFKFLVRTVKNTNTPYRLNPFNIYFHTYSGSKKPSLEALKANLDFARTQPIISLFTSQYAAIANAFYHTKIIRLDENQWRIDDRGDLQTIRFDKATLKTVNWQLSSGVIGQKHYQGNLYIALDPNDQHPVITLQPIDSIEYPVKSNAAYLIDSNWQIKDLQYVNKSLMFAAQGFGKGTMQWYWPQSSSAKVTVTRDNKTLSSDTVTTDVDGILHLTIDAPMPHPTKIMIEAL